VARTACWTGFKCRGWDNPDYNFFGMLPGFQMTTPPLLPPFNRRGGKRPPFYPPLLTQGGRSERVARTACWTGFKCRGCDNPDYNFFGMLPGFQMTTPPLLPPFNRRGGKRPLFYPPLLTQGGRNERRVARTACWTGFKCRGWDNPDYNFFGMLPGFQMTTPPLSPPSIEGGVRDPPTDAGGEERAGGPDSLLDGFQMPS